MKMGERVKRWREAYSLTQAQLAKKVGVSAGAVANWEVGANPPTSRNVELVARVLGVSMAEFWGKPPAPVKRRRRAA